MKVIPYGKKSNISGLLKPPGGFCMMAVLKGWVKPAWAVRGKVAHSPALLVWGGHGTSGTANLLCLCARECLHNLHTPVKLLQREETLCSPSPGADCCPPSVRKSSCWHRKNREPRDSCHHCPDDLCNSKCHVHSIVKHTSFPNWKSYEWNWV